MSPHLTDLSGEMFTQYEIAAATLKQKNLFRLEKALKKF